MMPFALLGLGLLAELVASLAAPVHALQRSAADEIIRTRRSACSRSAAAAWRSRAAAARSAAKTSLSAQSFAWNLHTAKRSSSG